MARQRALTNEELTDILVNFFTREIVNQRMILDDIPDRIRPYLPPKVIEQAARYDHGEFIDTLEYDDASTNDEGAD